MDKLYEVKRHRLVGYYWLFKAKNDLVCRLIDRTIHPNAAILDVGCGSGNLLLSLTTKKYKNFFGIDTSQYAIDECSRLGIKNVFLRDGSKTGFPSNFFDVIVASDVLEHINNEEQAISEWFRVLKKGGKLILSVPAFGFLWSHHDKACNHYRRYSRKALQQLLEKNNFEVKKLSYWNFLSFLPVCLMRLSRRFFPKRLSQRDQLYELPPFLNNSLTSLLKLENIIFLRWGFPFGVSLFAVAAKK